MSQQNRADAVPAIIKNSIAPLSLPDNTPLSPTASFTDAGGSGGTIPDGPSGATVDRPLVVSGLSGTVNSVEVTVTGFTHTFPQDLDFLLVAPDGGTRNLEFWSDVAGLSPVSNFTLTIADSGVNPIPPGTPVNGVTYKPAENQVVEANNYFVPFNNTINHAPLNGVATFASAFNGITGNGTWHLYIRDDESGDTGSFATWTLTILTTGGNQPPAIANLNGDSSTFTEGGAAVHLDSGTAAAVSDSDSANFDTGNLTASITINKFSAQDALRIDTSGVVSLSAGFTVGSTVSVSGTAIGTIAAAGTGAGADNLIITFNANATPARVTTLVDALTYFNSNSVNPNINPRTVAVTVNDGDGATSSPAVVTVNVAATGDEGMTTFTNGTGLTIPDSPAAAVSQMVNVSGLLGNVTDVKVTITGLTHAFASDLDFLLVGPNGTSNLEFWSDAAGNGPVSNINVSIADFGSTTLPNSPPVNNTTYRAADYGVTEANNYFGPSFTISHSTTNGIGVFSSSFGGIVPNGNWTLYVRDGQTGDTGTFTGWSIAIATDAGPPVNGPPVISNLNGDNPTFTEGGVAPLLLDVGGNASVVDGDSADFNTGNLTVSITANEFSTEDALGISTAGTITLSSGTSVGSTVSVSGTAIGTIAVAGTGTGGNDLIVTLNANATPARVTTLVNALTYFNSNSINPNINSRTVAVTINDGDGATSLPANVIVKVAATGDEFMTTFTNSTGLAIPDSPAAAVSQTLVVSGLSGSLLDVKITLNGLSHGFPQDLQMLLVAPDGTHNIEFWSNVGGGVPGFSNRNISVADFGTAILPGGTAPVTNTTYQAADYAAAEPNNYFGPTFTINHAGGNNNGIATFASSFAGLTGAAMNGSWTLYVRDNSSGDTGSFTSWSLDLAAPLVTDFAHPSGNCGAGNVPCFTTIQAAIDAISAGGTVNVVGGTFNESPNLNKSATVNINGATTVNGFSMSNGTLNASNGGSFALTLASGNLSFTGGVFNAGTGTVVFNGSAAQQAAGTTYNNLTINNTIGLNVTGVTLTGNAAVNGVLALTSSDLNTGAFTLTQPNTTASTGVSDVVGTVKRTGGPFAPAVALTFGNPNNRITFNGAGGTKPTDVTVLMAKAAPATYAAAVQRNYTISQTGGSGFTSTLRLHYLDSELNGNVEANLNLRRFTGAWSPVLPSVVDTTNNWVECNAVTGFSQWTFSSFAPTASGGTVTGRIVDQSGNPVEGAVVRLNGTQNRKFITDANGFYRFDNVETNGFYTVTPSRANYSFTPSVRSFSQIGESTEAAFGATLSTSNLLNPLDTPEYFVRQHYVDFLNREPDEAGFNFWSDQIIECGLASNILQNCIERRRENVSAAFFLSIEFQRTGGLVDGLYRAAYGARPDFAHFLPDTRTVGHGVRVGIDGWEAVLATNTEAFVNSFVNRPEFRTAYDNLSNAAYVDTLISHTGVSFTAAERDALLSGLGAGSMTRAEALRSIAGNSRFVSAKFNETFVMMEYFGYLRRDADANGFAFWLNKLNQFNGNFQDAEMVKAFLVSGEYRARFSQ